MSEIPPYPNSTIMFSESMAAAGGGGGMERNYATADPIEIVVAFYEERLGPAQRDAASGSTTWQFSESAGNGRYGRLLEVWHAAGEYPFRDAHHASPQPADARTVINYRYLYIPGKADGEPEPPID